MRALEALAPHMAQGALFTDVLSVKTQICEAYMGLKDKYPHIQLISTHPMSAPRLRGPVCYLRSLACPRCSLTTPVAQPSAMPPLGPSKGLCMTAREGPFVRCPA